MAVVIAQPCIKTKDTACTKVCPTDCIHPTPEEADFATSTQLYIDPHSCTECGLCVDECPVKAIFHEDDLPAEWQNFTKINADYFAKK